MTIDEILELDHAKESGRERADERLAYVSDPRDITYNLRGPHVMGNLYTEANETLHNEIGDADDFDTLSDDEQDELFEANTMRWDKTWVEAYITRYESRVAEAFEVLH